MRAGRRRLTMLTAAVVALGAGFAASGAGVLNRLEDAAVDVRFELRGTDRPDDLLVVAIDDATFSDLGRPWPFPRSLHARAVDRLTRAGARTIVYDVQFTEPTREREDLALYDAIARARRVVLATTEVDGRGRTNVLGGDENVARAHARVGAANLPSKAGGAIRRFTPETSGLPTLAVAGAEMATRRRIDPASFPRGGALVDYRGPAGTIRTVSFSDLLAGRVAPALVRDRVVVVGASAPTLQDVHATPVGDGALMSGPEVQANAIWTALHGLPLRDAPGWVELALIALLGLVAPLAALRWAPSRAAAVAVAAAAGYVVVCQLAFDANLVLVVVYPAAAALAGAAAAVAGGYLFEAREHRRVTRDRDDLEALVSERTRELRESQLEVVRRLAQAAEWRDTDTGEHIERMSRLSERLALATGMSRREAELLRHAAALHDIGKIAVPDSILRKPGRLEPAEVEEMKQHTMSGAAILAGSQSALLQLAEEIALTHHERWDGMGYPHGLSGAQIPLSGRICAICDVFDALTSARPYKEAWSVDEALAEIRKQAGSQFDPELVEVFARIVGAAEAGRTAGEPALAR